MGNVVSQANQPNVMNELQSNQAFNNWINDKIDNKVSPLQVSNPSESKDYTDGKVQSLQEQIDTIKGYSSKATQYMKISEERGDVYLEAMPGGYAALSANGGQTTVDSVGNIILQPSEGRGILANGNVTLNGKLSIGNSLTINGNVNNNKWSIEEDPTGKLCFGVNGKYAACIDPDTGNLVSATSNMEQV